MSGVRDHRVISYDREFLIYTLPAPRRRTAKVLPGRGVKVNYLYYWCEFFRDPRLGNSRVEVRYDPFDIGTVHAFVDNQWVECHSEYYHAFQGRSHKGLKLAAEELRKRWQNHSLHSATTAKKLAEFLAAAETQETVLAQRRADMEVRRAHADCASGAVVASSGITRGLREMLEGNNLKSPEVYGEF